MLKKIKLNIESYIDSLDEHGLPEGETEENVSSFFGVMKLDGDEITVSYKEADENGTVNCSVVHTPGCVTVRRNGAIVSVMVFDEKEIFKTVYSIPPYKFDMEIKTKRLSSTLTEHGGALDILYEMNIGGMRRAAKMKITVKEVDKI